MAAPWPCRHMAAEKEDMSRMLYGRFFRQALTERVFCSRTYSVVFLQGVIQYLYMCPVVRASKDMECGASPWVFPFLSSNLFLFAVVYGWDRLLFFRRSIYAEQKHVSGDSYR